MKALILAEKPSVGRDIARVMKCFQKGNGYFAGEQYIVTWALGHLVTLADPEMYDKKYKDWNLEHLPMLPNPLELVVIKQTNKQFNAVKNLLLRKDVNKVIIATDAGREGELVARWILKKANVKKPLQRLWISSITDQAILAGFNNLQNGQKYENLYAAAVSRAEADWLIGMNATRALTAKFNAQLSCGRVQTPTLAMIATREAEIQNFIPKQFYGLCARANGVNFIWYDQKTGENRLFSKEKIETIKNKLVGEDFTICEVTKTAKKKYAPALYDLTELQRDANRIYNYSAKETLSVMQQLYETHKIVTYPRSDSRYITTDIIPTLKNRIKACASRFPIAKKLLLSPIVANKSFVDDRKVTDHHAIIPTEQFVFWHKLTDKEQRIYNLVATRFLAVLLPAYEYEQTIVHAKINNEMFKASGRRTKVLGWKEITEGDAEDDVENNDQLPVFSKNMKLNFEISLTTGSTKPPEPFTEATLLTAMERPFIEVSDKKMAQTLKETGGLGTVATRADIIEKLQNTFLIEKRGKSFYTTSKGRQLLALAPPELKTPILTAKWEMELEKIAKGYLAKEKFIDDICLHTKKIVADIKNSEQKFKHDNLTGATCPECGKLLLEVNGKKGKMRVCQDRSCGYRKSISKETNARCPNCHKKLVMVGEGAGQMFTCLCGYREKLSAFQKRRGNKDSGQKASKHDVAKFLKNQSNETFDNPFAEALKNFKGDI